MAVVGLIGCLYLYSKLTEAIETIEILQKKANEARAALNNTKKEYDTLIESGHDLINDWTLAFNSIERKYDQVNEDFYRQYLRVTNDLGKLRERVDEIAPIKAQVLTGPEKVRNAREATDILVEANGKVFNKLDNTQILSTDELPWNWDNDFADILGNTQEIDLGEVR